MIQHITALETALQQPLTVDHIPVLHAFLYPLLSWQSSIKEENKWSMVLECWLAIYQMKPEGNFGEALELTGLLAKMEYHCRSVTLYESYLHRQEFPDGSLHL
jgi:hypothetical protein